LPFAGLSDIGECIDGNTEIERLLRANADTVFQRSPLLGH
jgi:hypothetical protein